MSKPSLLRSRDTHARVTYVELFFDLVFVFAVTQLSHSLVKHLDLAGALQTLLLLLLGGPALYLAGNIFFKRASAQHYPLSHLVGLGLLALLAPVSMLMTPLMLGAATTAVLVIVAVWETRSFSRGPAPQSGH